MNKSLNKKIKGFTLIELAIVLLIIGLILGGFIGTISSRIEATHIAGTQRELEDIKTAIYGYAYVNGQLPCPDCSAVGDGTCPAGEVADGGEDKNGVACHVGDGNVPWRTLGLAQGDAWNNKYEYWVDANASNSVAKFTIDADIGSGKIKQRKSDGTALVTLANNVAAIILSRGKNGLGAKGIDGIARAIVPGSHVDEIENGNGNSTFVSRSPTTKGAATAGGEFDDIVIWISEFELKAKMVEAGKLP